VLLVFGLAAGALWLVQAFGGPTQSANTAFIAGGTVAVALGFGSILWGFLVGQRRVSVERIDLPMRHLPPQLAGIRIAHITDLHIGRQLRAPRLRKLLDRVNELEPDLIVLTGDIFDFDPSFIEEGCQELSKLHARHGVFAVLGNHDIYTGAEAVAAGINRLTSIRLLRDEWVALEIDGTPLYLLGIDDNAQALRERDSESRVLERLAREVPQDAARILLVHRPSYFRQAAALGLPVSLAGHTHGGQISLPPPAHHHNISRLATRWTRGLFVDGDSLLYVNRGLGVAGPPVRLNCPREIALLRLVPRR
jgi:predicted MPP superfamily phosphohydrolase